MQALKFLTRVYEMIRTYYTMTETMVNHSGGCNSVLLRDTDAKESYVQFP